MTTTGDHPARQRRRRRRRLPPPAGAARAAGRLDPDALAALEEERDFLLRSLDDLEREHDAGDVDDHDYETLKDDYTARAARRDPGDRVAPRPDGGRPAAAARGGGSPPRWPAVGAFAVLAGVLVAQASGRRGGGRHPHRRHPRVDPRAARRGAARWPAGATTRAPSPSTTRCWPADPTTSRPSTYKGWFQFLSRRRRGHRHAGRAAEADPELPRHPRVPGGDPRPPRAAPRRRSPSSSGSTPSIRRPASPSRWRGSASGSRPRSPRRREPRPPRRPRPRGRCGRRSTRGSPPAGRHERFTRPSPVASRSLHGTSGRTRTVERHGPSHLPPPRRRCRRRRRRHLARPRAAPAGARPRRPPRWARGCVPPAPFTLGVASGDPRARRGRAVDPARPRPPRPRRRHARGAGARRTGRSPPTTGSAGSSAGAPSVAQPGEGHTVHVEVGGLRPGRHLLVPVPGRPRGQPGRAHPHRPRPRGAHATGPGSRSPPARTTRRATTPPTGRMAAEDLDFVVFLGDYIYEGPPNPAALRQHDGVGEPFTLDDYRARHARYRSDPTCRPPTPPSRGSSRSTTTRSTTTGPTRSRRTRRCRPPRRSWPGASPPSRPTGSTCRCAAAPGRRGLDMRAVPPRTAGATWLRSTCSTPASTAPTSRSTSPAPTTRPRRCWARTRRLARPRAAAPGARWNVLAQQTMVASNDRRAGPEEQFDFDNWDGYRAGPPAPARLAGAGPQPGRAHRRPARHLGVRPEGPTSPIRRRRPSPPS